MIIGVSGKARSGKGEFAKIAKEKYGAHIVSFAGALKEEVIEFLQKNKIPFTKDNIYGENKYREQLFSMTGAEFPEAIDLVNRFGVLDSPSRGNYMVSYRSLLQWWGTEYRRAQDVDYWVKRALAKCERQHVPIKTMRGPVSVPLSKNLYVIDDLRFENEAAGIIDAGGKLVRVNRPNNPNPISNPYHPSECSLDEWLEWEYIIENDGPIEYYHAQCELVLKEMI